MKKLIGMILATLLTIATLSAHAALPASAETLFPLDENPAATEEAMPIMPGVTPPQKAGTPCPCNTRDQVIGQPAMTGVADNAAKNNAFGALLTGPGTAPIPANSAGGTQ
jgi:hypothetical protein